MINEGASFYVQVDKRLGVFGLPFLFNGDEPAQKAVQSSTASKLLANLEDKGIKACLAIGSNGWIDIATRDKAVRAIGRSQGTTDPGHCQVRSTSRR